MPTTVPIELKPVMLQRGMLDWVALSLGLAASLRPAADGLTPTRPPDMLCTVNHFLHLLVMLLVSGCMYWGCSRWLVAQAWYRGGNGSSIAVCLTATVPPFMGLILHCMAVHWPV